MKILCVVQRFHPVIGGSENLTKSFLDYLSERHEVVVYTSNANDHRSFWNPNKSKIHEENNEKYSIKRFEILTSIENRYDADQKFIFGTSYPGPFLPKMWSELVLKKIDFDLIIVTAYPYDHVRVVA